MESIGQVACARIDLLRALSALTLYAPGRLKVLFYLVSSASQLLKVAITKSE